MPVPAWVLVAKPAKRPTSTTFRAIAGVVVGVVLAGCGATGTSGPSAAEKASAVHTECQKVTQKALTKLQSLNSKIGVGMTFDVYGQQVGDAKSAYDEMLRSGKAQGGVSTLCVGRVATPLQHAMQDYLDAYNTWNDCMKATSCTFDGATLKKAQASWTKATAAVNRASDGLDALAPRPG